MIEPISSIPFDGFYADEVYPCDIDGDGIWELLCLQSPGIYKSNLFDGGRWALPADEQAIDCLTAIKLDGRVRWQSGTPYMGKLGYGGHVADQMLCHWAGEAGTRIACLRRRTLAILDATTGDCLNEVDLAADNFTIVRPWWTPLGLRLVVKNTELAASGYWYGDPTQIYDEHLNLCCELPAIVGSGHSPRLVDIDNDGVDELLVGYEAFDYQGNRLWRVDEIDEQSYDPIQQHVDQLQVADSVLGRVILYAGSQDFHAVDCRGRRLWYSALGHPQHLLVGDFRTSRGKADIACLNLQTGFALQEWCQQHGRSDLADAESIVFLTIHGEIVDVLQPATGWPAGVERRGGCHSGEGMLLLPGGARDHGDAIVTRDFGWPIIVDGRGCVDKLAAPPGEQMPADAVHPDDGFGVRVFSPGAGHAPNVLIHCRTRAWLYAPPVRPSTANVQPWTGQGNYAVL